MTLRRADLEAILGFLGEVNDLEPEEPYPAEVLARLSRLVRCDEIAYQDADVVGRRFASVTWVGPEDSPDSDDALYWALGMCPIMRHRMRTGDQSAIRTSDVIDRRRYHELPIYREYFAPAGVDNVIDLWLPGVSGQVRSLVLFRYLGVRDFSERDREVLQVVRPHLSRLEVQAGQRRQLTELLRARGPVPGMPPSARDVDAYAGLTSREREIVDLVAQGKTNAQIAAELWVAPSTVKKHLEHVYEKLGVGRRTAAVAYARSSR